MAFGDQIQHLPVVGGRSMEKQVAMGIVWKIILSSEKGTPEITTAWNFCG